MMNPSAPMLRFALLLALCPACTMDFGHGKISPVVVERQIDLSKIPVTAQAESQFSMSDTGDLMSAADAAKYDKKYAGEVDAVDEVQLLLTEATVRDEFGEVLPDATLSIALADVPLVLGQNVELPGPITAKFTAAVHAHEALTLPVELQLSLPQDDAHQRLTARAVVQPIVTVNAIDAIQ
jgi:hypothetical protein